MQFFVWLLLAGLAAQPQATASLANEPLQACWRQQVQPLQDHYLRFAYQEQRYELEHSAEPWQQTPYQASGTVWVNATHFRQSDTLRNLTRHKSYYAKTQATDQTLLLLRPGEDKLASVTPEMVPEQLIQAARYSPIGLIDYVYRHHISLDAQQSTAVYACYRTTINQTATSLFIRRADNRLSHLTTLKADDLLGDVLSTFTYSDYVKQGKVLLPTRTAIDKVNGRLHDQVQLSQETILADAPNLIERPVGYELKPAVVSVPAASVEKYSEHIYFINLPHTDDKVMLVEFADFLLVAEAPLSSPNGELIIREARRLAPTKPIRYFVFGHHHPHYVGGIRPFVHKGATILCSPGNESYVRELVQAPHRLQPDSLALAPRTLKLEGTGTRKTITDGQFTMEIYLIGNQSAHTNDYLIYYFPGEQLVFEDDLVWIAKTGSPAKASARQVGLYRAIRQLGLPVRTLIQSWPVADYGVKTTIPFMELEASVPEKGADK